jgi:hypothetical protein
LKYHSVRGERSGEEQTMSSAVCAACRRGIDAAARTCPYCGANPVTGERIDTQALLQAVFRPKDLSTSENVIEFARQRQGIVVGVSVLVVFLLLVVAHQFVTRRNASAVSEAPPVPLTEIADLADRNESRPQPLPELDFHYDGRPQAMRTYIVERGAIAPAAPVPAGQAQPVPPQQQQPQPQAQPQQPARAPRARPQPR